MTPSHMPEVHLEEKEQHLMKRTLCQLLSMEVDVVLCFGYVGQPVDLETSANSGSKCVSQEAEAKRGWLLQQDIDPKHTLKSTRNYCKELKLELLEQPSQS